MPTHRTAIVTGATGGVGHALLPALLAEGFDVLAQYHSTAPSAEYAGVTWFHGWEPGVPPEAEVTALIHCAGVCSLGRIADTPRAEWDNALTVNLVEPVMLTTALLPKLREAGGHMVYVNSGSGLTAKAGWGTYCASKFAAKAWCDTLRQEGPAIRVTSIHPGRINTRMQEAIVAQEGGTYDGSRFIQPDTVARAILSALTTPPDATPTEIMLRPRA